MNNLFLRLYLLIVASVICIGVVLNAFWQSAAEDPASGSEYDRLVVLVVMQLKGKDPGQLSARIDIINHQLALDFSLMGIDEMPSDLFFENGQPVSSVLLENNEETAIYHQMPVVKRILKLHIPQDTDLENKRLYFLLIFYGLIAVTIFYWIWPLSQDLNRLERAVDNFATAQWRAKVKITNTSSIAHLANAYNRLLDKIKRLVENEKAMTSSISHELRTPLARIRFALQMAKEADDKQQIAVQLSSIEDDVSEMNQLIAELLNYASIEKKSFVAKQEKGDIGTLINTLISRLSKNFPDKRITFEAKGLTLGVQCDSYLMERAMQNLIVNACKYGNENVKISFSQLQHLYCIRVEDDGAGIAPNMREKIFDSYYQIPDSDQSKGFGLGLAIVKRVVELHSGDVIVETSAQGGASFIISWPKKII